MKNQIIRLSYILLAELLLFSSCATVFNSSKHKVRLISSPHGANVHINGKDVDMVTPCELKLNRKVKPSLHNQRNEYVYLFLKKGYKDVEVVDKRKINGLVYVNFLTGYLMPITITTDFVTGASYVYRKEIYATLSPFRQQVVTNNQVANNITVDNSPPTVKLISPKLGRGFKKIVTDKNISLLGKAEDENGIYEVKVNNKQATVSADGMFEADVPLVMGNNKITITAKDGRMNAITESFFIERTNPALSNESDNKLNDYGTYYALIIGVQDYEDPYFNDLGQPVSDAQKLLETLTSYYDFKIENVKFLENPDRSKITSALEYYFETITDKDNLLVFYAGHGYWDKNFKQGYWLPADAQEDNRGTWLSNSTIRDYMRAIPSKHSLLITDACFAGGIFKSRDAFPDASKAINQMYKLPSRKAMTSGAMNVVPDKSVFIEYLIKRLIQNKEKYLSSEQLFASFKLAVVNNSPLGQVPQFGEIRETGDEGGDFIFIKKD